MNTWSHMAYTLLTENWNRYAILQNLKMVHIQKRRSCDCNLSRYVVVSGWGDSNKFSKDFSAKYSLTVLLEYFNCSIREFSETGSNKVTNKHHAVKFKTSIFRWSSRLPFPSRSCFSWPLRAQDSHRTDTSVWAAISSNEVFDQGFSHFYFCFGR